jgi:hypothetical protein
MLTHIATTESVSLCVPMKSWRLFWNSRGWFPPIFWQPHNANEALPAEMTLIEIKPHRWGWKVFEAPSVEPVFPQKDQAIDYAQNRACFRCGEIRVRLAW